MDREELPDLEQPDRRVLAICGGGYAGLFAAEFLARLETRLGGGQLGQRFDLIAGTSIGGLLALGLAKGMNAADLPQLLTELGPQLFGRPGFGLLKPKHDVAPLAAKLKQIFGDATLSTLQHQVLVPAVNVTGGEAYLFGNGPNNPTRTQTVREAALATSAAPWFLPPQVADHRLYADGGLIANSPESLAAVEAVHGRGWPRDKVTMLVVGSTQVSARLPGHLVGNAWGLRDWLKDKRLLTTTMRAQMSLAGRQADLVLGADRIFRADVELNAQEQKRVALDKANDASTEVLKTLAKERFERFCADHPLLLDRWSA
ncbi:CBASS cGAMP-activated phospholipase [Phenylobacterium sp.]|uniref:CBASS cGAMP-activated phospholipase n=1 Tax=Phenylobacterium sp. TaxID=1871053 RepID=UPI0035B37774